MTRGSPKLAALLLPLVMLLPLACATSGRTPEGGVSIEGEEEETVEDVREELAGIVLTGRHFALDGQLNLTVAAPDSATARAALEAGIAAVDSVEGLVGLHLAPSELRAVNEAAGKAPVPVSPWTEELVAVTLAWAERTGGAFDPTIGPLVEAWGFGGGGTVVSVDSLAIEAARERVDWRKIRLDREAHTVFLADSGMVFDLRAAAKGFALDRLVEAMREAGATSGMAVLDGDQVFFGPGSEDSGREWTVSVPDPYAPNIAFARFELPPGGVSTTSPYARVVEIDGQRYSHLIDPRTGYPVRTLASTTVYAERAVDSDVLSTALFVLGSTKGCDLIEEWPEVGVLLVLDAEEGGPSTVCMSPALRRHLERLDPPTRPVVPPEG